MQLDSLYCDSVTTETFACFIVYYKFFNTVDIDYWLRHSVNFQIKTCITYCLQLIIFKLKHFYCSTCECHNTVHLYIIHLRHLHSLSVTNGHTARPVTLKLFVARVAAFLLLYQPYPLEPYSAFAD